MAQYQIYMGTNLRGSIWRDVSPEQSAEFITRIAQMRGISVDAAAQLVDTSEFVQFGTDWDDRIRDAEGTRCRQIADARAKASRAVTSKPSVQCRVCGETNPGRFTTLPAGAGLCDDCV